MSPKCLIFTDEQIKFKQDDKPTANQWQIYDQKQGLITFSFEVLSSKLRYKNTEEEQLGFCGIEQCGCLQYGNLRMSQKYSSVRPTDSLLTYLEESLWRLSSLNLHLVLKIPNIVSLPSRHPNG